MNETKTSIHKSGLSEDNNSRARESVLDDIDKKKN